MYHPDLDGLDPEGHRDVVVETRLGTALYTQLGLPSPLPPGSFLDLFPITVMTTSTLAALQELRPESRFDVRRFRMNLVVDTDEPGWSRTTGRDGSSRSVRTCGYASRSRRCAA